MCEIAQVDDVNAEQAEQHHGLAPLRGVAPEHPHILDGERADGPVEAGKPGGYLLEQAGGRPGVFGGAEQIYFETAARAALHRRRRVVEQTAEARERNAAEKQRVAQQHQRKKHRAAQDAFRPLQHRRRQPEARQEREQRETRLGQQLVEGLQRAFVEHLVRGRLGLPPERRDDQQDHGRRHNRNLEITPVQKPPDQDGQPRADDAGQNDEQRDQAQGYDVKMPRHLPHQPERDQQRRDQK